MFNLGVNLGRLKTAFIGKFSGDKDKYPPSVVELKKKLYLTF